MADISLVVADHRAAGLPFIVYLRHPPTCGVLTSWGSLGHVTIGEPGALVGFLGPRVYEARYGKRFPEGVQTSENPFAKRLIDGGAAPNQVGGRLDRALRVLMPERDGVPENPPVDDVDSWESVTISRRPGVPAYDVCSAMPPAT